MAQVMLGRWVSVDPASNRFRVYRLELGADLWQETCLVKVWGRIGRRPQQRFYWPEDSKELAQLLQEVIRKRGLHGYRVW